MTVLVELDDADARCGAKAASLARLRQAGFEVPAGFVIPDPLDDGWRDEVEQALHRLGAGPFAVRSSGLEEDGAEVSFAGQLHTALDVTSARVSDAVTRVAESGRTRRAAVYASRTGSAPVGVVPVIVQVMVHPEAAGVLATRHPVTGVEVIVIEAATGLGDRVVDGTVTPESWTIDGPVLTGPTDLAGAVLSAAVAGDLAVIAQRVEALFGCPQDIEWAVADGKVWVLQARPLTGTQGVRAGHAPAAGAVLLRGTPASPGVVAGPVRTIAGLDGFHRLGQGDVLVCDTTSPAWTPLLARAGAVVTARGGMLSHAAIVAREFGIPAVTGAEGAMTVLAEGCHVVVDGGRGIVSAGHDRAVG